MIVKFDKDVGWPVLVMPLSTEKPGYVLGCPMSGPMHGQVVWVPRDDLVDVPPSVCPPQIGHYRAVKSQCRS